MLEHSYIFVLMTITVMTFVLPYVNDIIVTRSSEPFIQSLIHRLNKHFVLKDLRDLYFFLGIQVYISSSSIHLSQQTFITDLLHLVEMFDCKPVLTLMASNTSLSQCEGEVLILYPTTYQSIVGVLQYCTITN